MSLKKRGYTTWSTQVKGASAGPSGVATRRRRTEKSWVIAVDSGMAKQGLLPGRSTKSKKVQSGYFRLVIVELPRFRCAGAQRGQRNVDKRA